LGETRVDLQHLLEDIRDAYPGSLEETIVTEIVANSLDSGASTVRLRPDAARAVLTVVDDGSGMSRRDLARYHDIAASTKSRGEGIGFAGVGIKLGILASEEVYTETRRGMAHVATSWRLASRHKAPWRWMPPLGLAGGHGTAVRLKLRNPLSPLLETGFIEATLHRHFQPLLDPAFDEVLSEHYPSGVEFVVGDRPLTRTAPSAGRSPITVRLGRRRRPAAVGYLERVDGPLPEEQQGLAVATLGKVIKRGWDWLGFAPAEADRVSGLVEVPGLAGCLTLNKADFFRAGPRGATYLAYRKALQEAVSALFAAWGDAKDALREEARRRRARPVERDLAAVLQELADDFPLIASLVEQKAGGQKRLAMAGAGPGGTGLVGAGLVRGTAAPGAAVGEGTNAPSASGATSAELAATAAGSAPQAVPEGVPPPEARPADTTASAAASVAGSHLTWPGGRGRRRPGRLGLTIQFESRPDDPQLGRLVESTVWVNDAHPAYLRAAASRAEGYHLALTVAMALAPLAAEAAEAHGFVTAFLGRWGEALDRPHRRTRAAARPRRGPPPV
jgi:hypothetical protein